MSSSVQRCRSQPNQHKIQFSRIYRGREERKGGETCRLDVAGDVEEVERVGGRRRRRSLHPRRHVRVLHPRLPLQHSPSLLRFLPRQCSLSLSLSKQLKYRLLAHNNVYVDYIGSQALELQWIESQSSSVITLEGSF
jgi:hypothetical protein